MAQNVLLSERVVSAPAHQATVETVRRVTDAAGRTVGVTNRYVELATGLNRRDPATGQWVRAQDAIEAFDGSFFSKIAGNVVALQSGEMSNEDESQATGELFLLHWRPEAGNTQLVIGQIKWRAAEILEHACFAPFALPLCLELEFCYE